MGDLAVASYSMESMIQDVMKSGNSFFFSAQHTSSVPSSCNNFHLLFLLGNSSCLIQANHITYSLGFIDCSVISSANYIQIHVQSSLLPLGLQCWVDVHLKSISKQHSKLHGTSLFAVRENETN